MKRTIHTLMKLLRAIIGTTFQFLFPSEPNDAPPYYEQSLNRDYLAGFPGTEYRRGMVRTNHCWRPPRPEVQSPVQD